MLSKIEPENFNKRFDIVGCFLEYDGKFLILKRHPHKTNGNKWGLPAGKREGNESLMQALIRETEEETGLLIPESSLTFFDSTYVRDGSFDIEWHMFSAQLETEPKIKMNADEHSEFLWVTPEESLDIDLIHDLPESIQMFYKI